MVKASVMEMRMILAIATRSLHGIEAAQEGLAIQHRDLSRQVEWIKDEIRKIDHDDDLVPPSFCDRGTTINQNLPEALCNIGHRVDSSLPPGTLEVWQHGKRIGRIENIGLS